MVFKIWEGTYSFHMFCEATSFFVFLSGPDAKRCQDQNHTFKLVSRFRPLLDAWDPHFIGRVWSWESLNVPINWGIHLERWLSESLPFSPPGYALMTVCFVGMYMRARHFAARSWAGGKKGRKLNRGKSMKVCMYLLCLVLSCSYRL